MTGCHGVFARLRNRVIATAEVFGALDGGGELPALEFTSRHHLLKVVNGQLLRRPPWFYDSNMQGDGLVDIQSHYVDQAQWIVAPEQHFQVDQDVEILDAARWNLSVPLALFQESTGETRFPEYLDGAVADGQDRLSPMRRLGAPVLRMGPAGSGGRRRYTWFHGAGRVGGIDHTNRT